MHDKPGIVISDTSCLIILSKIGELHLLKQMYSKVFVTTVIAKEFGVTLPDWIIIRDSQDRLLTLALETNIDKGEASALSLAMEIGKDTLVILDDLKARKFAEKLGVNITATLGVVLKAQKEGIIKNALEIVNKIEEQDFRISKTIIDRIKKEINNYK